MSSLILFRERGEERERGGERERVRLFQYVVCCSCDYLSTSSLNILFFVGKKIELNWSVDLM